MKKYKKKIIIRLIVGFVLGAGIGNLVALLFGSLSGGGIVSAELVDKIGLAGAIILQTLFSGILGVASVGGMLLYEIDNWSLATATTVHFLSISVCFVVTSVILNWLPPDVLYYAIAIGAMALGFTCIWMIMYLRWKKEVGKMNEELKEYKEKQQKD